MDSGTLMIVGKLALTFGVLLGLPLWELWQLRRLGKQRRKPAMPCQVLDRSPGQQ